MLLDPYGQIAQHIFVQPLLTLNFIKRSGERVHIEQREMRLAIFAHTIGEGLHAPLLHLRDLASHLFDDALELTRELFNLLRAGVLARQKHMFIKRHANVLSLRPTLSSAQSPSSLGKGSSARKAGTQDAGPTGPALDVYPAPVRSAPGWVERKSAFYGGAGQ